MKKLMAMFVLASLGALAQDQVITELTKHWKTSKAFTLAVANAMPDESYSFKATPEEMSFGDMVAHIAQGNAFYCGQAAGTKAPFTKPATVNKASATKAIEEAFDFCIATVSGLHAADLNKMMGASGKQQSSVRELLLGGFTHTAHHRGQLEVYLRLKGIKPPDYQF